jgi:hypothetical protein
MRRIFVISDLHLGGAPDEPNQVGSQICNAYPELIQFIDWIRDHGKELTPEEQAKNLTVNEVELVINGDIVDLLANDPDDKGKLSAGIWTPDQEEVGFPRLSGRI